MSLETHLPAARRQQSREYTRVVGRVIESSVGGSMLNGIDRRDFLKTGVAAAAAFQAKNVLGANDRVRIAVVGLRGRGFDHIKSIHATPNVELAAICDMTKASSPNGWATSRSSACPSRGRLATSASCWRTNRSTPSRSPRRNHWHSLMGIWACQAGKDAYVEKPCSHNWWEGKQLVAAANKYNRIVQHGTQSRSSVGAKEAVQHLRDGLVATCICRAVCATNGAPPSAARPNRRYPRA